MAAKTKDENRDRQIKAVLIHEICHYTMLLIYENNENPYHKKDTKSKTRFDAIVCKYNKWTNGENSEEYDDKCNGIISTVFTNYELEAHHAELIVRPAHILAQFSNDVTKSNDLEKMYIEIFEYFELFVLPQLRKFNLQNRENVKKLNNIVGLLPQIRKENFKFIATKKAVYDIKQNQSYIFTTNVPNLLLNDIYQNLQSDDLANTKNLFIKPNLITSNEILFRTYNDIVNENKNIRVIIDCSSGIENKFQMLLVGSNYIFVTSNERQPVEIMQKLNLKINQHVVKYSFSDLEKDSQLALLKNKINFQKNNMSLDEVFSNENGPDMRSYVEILDDKTLKNLVENSEVSINAKIEIEKNFENLFQPRKLFKVSKEGENLNDEISQEEFLEAVKIEKRVIISDIQKNGKSWFLKNVAMTLRNSMPVKWITYIELQHFKNFLNHKIINIDFVKFIIENVICSQTKFEQNVFKKMYKNGRTCIIINGIDELPDEYKVITELFNSFKYNGGNQLLISSNGQFKEKMENEHPVYKLADFTEENAVEFITMTWILHDMEAENVFFKTKREIESYIKKSVKYADYKEYARNLCKKIFNSKFHETGMPFICYLAAENFNGKDKCSVIDSEVERIYEQYIQSKMQAFARRHSNMSNQDETFMAIHEYHAIKNKFPLLIPVFELIYKNVKWAEEDIIACGLMSNRNGNVIFDHGNFNEYFYLTFIPKVLKNLKRLIDETGADDFIKNAITEYFKSRKFDMTRSFIDSVFNQYSDVIEVKQFYLKIVGEKYENEDFIEIFLKILQKVFCAPSENENVRKITEVLGDVFGDVDLIKSGLEFFQDASEALGIGNKFLSKKGRESEITDSDPKSDFGTLSTFLFVDTNVFEPIYNDFMTKFSKWEQTNVLKQSDRNQRNILYICVENRKNKKLKFLWENMENHFKSIDRHEDFKALIYQESLPFKYNLVHAAAVFAHDEEFHEIFWPLLLQTFSDQTELMTLLLKKDINGHNFTHNLLIFNFSVVITPIFQKLRETLYATNYMKILNLKTPNGNNLLHINIIKKFGLFYMKLIWEIFENSCENANDFVDILKKKNDEKNNIFQLEARFSKKTEIFEFFVNEIERISSKYEVKLFLKNKDISKRNFIQSAVKQNESLICHEYFWDIIEKYFETSEILEFINDCDNENNNILHIAVTNNTEEIVKFTLEKIQQFLNKDEYDEYLKRKGFEGKTLLKQSFKNIRNIGLSKWVDELIRK